MSHISHTLSIIHTAAKISLLISVKVPTKAKTTLELARVGDIPPLDKPLGDRGHVSNT